MDRLDPPKPCEVLVAGEWWPGEVRYWNRTPDGWEGFCQVHVWEVRDVPRLGPRRVPLSYIQWVPADRLRERDGNVIDVEAWARERDLANDESRRHPEG